MSTGIRGVISYLRRNLAAGGVYFIYGLLRILPRSAAIAVCRIVGRAAWLLDRSGRRVVFNNLDIAFGADRMPASRKTLGMASYVNLAVNLADLSRVSRLSGNKLDSMVVRNPESIVHLDSMSKGNLGAIVLTPHLGNWELLTAYLANMGLKVHFVGREPYDQRLRKLYESVRTSRGGEWISRGGAFDRLREVLGDGEIAIMLIDQDTGRVKGTFVDFFDRKAWTPTGPAVLARLTGSVLIPCALVREKDHSYSLLIEQPVDTVETGIEDYDDWENTRRASLAMESLVRRYPDQWAWFHRRWRTRPPESWIDPVPPVEKYSEGGDEAGS